MGSNSRDNTFFDRRSQGIGRERFAGPGRDQDLDQT
jgi:hypothetical protein